MRIEGWLAQNCRFAGSDLLVHKALTSVMSWKVSLGKEKFAEALQAAGMTMEQFNGMLRPLLNIQAVPAEFEPVFVDLIEEPWQVLDPRTIKEFSTVAQLAGQGSKSKEQAQDEMLVGMAKMNGYEGRLLNALLANPAYQQKTPLMASIYEIMLSDRDNRDWADFKKILKLRWDVTESILASKPQLFIGGFFLFSSWALSPQEFSPGVLSVLLDAVAGMRLSSMQQAHDVLAYLSKVNPPLSDKARKVYDALVRGDAAMRGAAIGMELSNMRSALEMPETRKYIESAIGQLASDPAALSSLVMERGDDVEGSLRSLGLKLPDMVPIYEDALRKFSASKANMASEDDLDAGKEMMTKFSGTESSRKALRFFADNAKSQKDIPGLKAVFYLRADLLSRQEMYDSFLSSWKISARTHNAQATQLVLNDDPSVRGEHGVEPFFNEHTPSHFEGVAPDGVGTAGEHVIRSLSSPKSYEAMRRTFKEIYEKTQRTLVKDILARDKYAAEILVKDKSGQYVGINMLRGVEKAYSVPSILESWTSDGYMANVKFDDHAVWMAPVPLKARLIAFVSPHWGRDFGPGTAECEYEYIVIRSFVGPEDIAKNVFGKEEEAAS